MDPSSPKWQGGEDARAQFEVKTINETKPVQSFWHNNLVQYRLR